MLFRSVISVVCWVAVTMYIGFKCIDNGVGLRVSEEEELEGLDMAEHGLTSAYAGFNITDALSGFMDINENTDLGEDFYDKASKKQIDMAVPVIGDVPKTNTEGKRITPYTESGMCKITILCRQNKFEALKKALNELGVTGMTATQVLGCGIQRGVGKTYHPNHRRNAPSATNGILCPMIALALPSFVYFPILGPRSIAPIQAAVPPTK